MHEDHIKKLEEIQEAIAKREEEWEKARQEWEKAKKEIKPDNYLYTQIEERYKKNIILPSLEEKKQQLNEIRNFHKPIRKEELDEF